MVNESRRHYLKQRLIIISFLIFNVNKTATLQYQNIGKPLNEKEVNVQSID